jgi:hypothetical protein
MEEGLIELEMLGLLIVAELLAMMELLQVALLLFM